MIPNVSLAPLLLADSSILEQRCVTYWMQTCTACQSAVRLRWYCLCPDHAPSVRAILDPSYLPWLRARIASGQERLLFYQTHLPLMQRIEHGLQWIAAQTDPHQQARGKAKLARLRESLPPSLQSLGRADLDRLIDMEQRNLAARQRRMALIAAATDLLLVLASELGQSPGGERPPT